LKGGLKNTNGSSLDEPYWCIAKSIAGDEHVHVREVSGTLLGRGKFEGGQITTRVQTVSRFGKFVAGSDSDRKYALSSEQVQRTLVAMWFRSPLMFERGGPLTSVRSRLLAWDHHIAS
jgi:hypothetical protein